MLKKSHIAFSHAVISGSVLVSNYPIKAALPLFVGAHFGAFAPDLDGGDTYDSELTRLLGKLNFLQYIPHRTYTHTLWIVALLVLLFYQMPQIGANDYLIRNLILGFTVSYALHLILDNFSKQGVNWFFPFGNYRYNPKFKSYQKKRKYHWYYYRVNGNFELWFRQLCRLVIAINFYLLYLQWF